MVSTNSLPHREKKERFGKDLETLGFEKAKSVSKKSYDFKSLHTILSSEIGRFEKANPVDAG